LLGNDVTSAVVVAVAAETGTYLAGKPIYFRFWGEI